MKYLIIAATMIAMPAFGEQTMTDNDKMRFMLESENISYVWRDEDHGPVITVFGDTNPAAICTMGNKIIEMGVDLVHNYTTDEMIYCNDGR
jgi:hypothetical protein